MPATDGTPAVSPAGLRRLVAAARATSRPLTAAAATLTAASSLVPVAFTFASGALIGAVPAAVAAGTGTPETDRLWRWLLVVAALFVVQHSLDQLRTQVVGELGWRTQMALRRRVLVACLAPAGIGHLEDSRMLDRISVARGVDDGRFSPERALGAASNLAVTFLGAAGASVILMGYRWWFGLGLGLGFWFFGQRARRKFHLLVRVLANQVPGLRRSDWFCEAATGGASKEARVFGLGGFLTDRFRTHWLDAMEEVWRQRSGIAPTFAWVPVALGALRWIGLLTLVNAAAEGRLSPTELGVYVQAVLGVAAFATLDDDSWNLAQGLVSVPEVEKVERYLKTPARGVVAAGTPPTLPANAPAATIRFEDVTFAYPSVPDQPVFDHLDLELRAGSSTAIVGLNGAGKTTLVKLLARLYTPDAGRIIVDGADLAHFDAAEWQRRIAAIFQDFTRYELSVVDNVSWGAPHLHAEPARLQKVLDRADATRLVERLPHAADTYLSPKFTGGVDLSGGQWQRIALARALYAVEGGARILVLDEPTAHLDVRAEVELYDRFLELTAGLTSVVISHRFSTVRRADRIVVLDGGQVVEAGSHEELLAAGGPYGRLFRLQAARFASDSGEGGSAADADAVDAEEMREARNV